MKKIIPFLVVTATLFIFTSISQADLLGSTANCSITPNGAFWACSPDSTTVIDPGSEFDLNLVGQTFFDIDISQSSIDINQVAAGGLAMGAGEVFDLSFTGSGYKITGISGLSLSGGVSGFDISDISFESFSVSMLFNGTSWNSGSSATVNLALAPVPEPATMLLLGTGLVGVAGAARRKKKNQA